MTQYTIGDKVRYTGGDDHHGMTGIVTDTTIAELWQRTHSDLYQRVNVDMDQPNPQHTWSMESASRFWQLA